MEPIIVSQNFSIARKEVWKTITERDAMVEWFFDNIPEFRAQVGFETKFNVLAPSRDFLHLWQVTEVIPEERIVVRWTYKNLEGKAFVHFDLEDHKEGCTLTVKCVGIESFDQRIPEFTR